MAIMREGAGTLPTAVGSTLILGGWLGFGVAIEEQGC